MTKNPNEGNNSSNNSSGRDDRRGDRPRTNAQGYNRAGSSDGNRNSSGRDDRGGNDRPRYGQGGGNRSNSGGGYGNDRPRREGGDFKPRQDYKPRENRDGQQSSGSSYPPRENRYNRDDRSSDRPERNSPYPKRENSRPSDGGGYERREGGYNRDNNRDNRSSGGYNRDNRDNRGNSGGYNRDNRNNGGYNRDNNRDNNRSSNAGYNNRNRGGSNDRPRREGEAGDRRNPIANKIRSAYYNSYKNEEGSGGGSRDSYRQRSDSRPKRQEHAPNYKLPVEEGYDAKVSRLNKYIANSGICSRREADKLIEQGLISVNGKVVAELGFKVNQGDEVRYEGRVIRPEKMVYVLLNKPKDFITTTEDPDERRTVMNLVSNACFERIYPVGRLDRNTTGLLLFTNDGDLAKRLTHPSHNISKIYQVELDRPLAKEDFDTISAGFQLEDGRFKSDDLAYIDPSNPSVIGIEIHEGRNRLVRRVFEHFNYKVFKLDRVLYAGLTKKDLPRGNWRYLTEKEVIGLKYKNN